MCCKVSWCKNKTSYYNQFQQYKYCDVHNNYKQYARNAPKRPWLFYKVERILNNELICEHCGLDMIHHYGEDNFKAIITAMDVDHIDPKTKGTPQGEQPSNYQLLCKMCHIIKSHKEGDYVNYRYKRGNKK